MNKKQRERRALYGHHRKIADVSTEVEEVVPTEVVETEVVETEVVETEVVEEEKEPEEGK